MMGPQSTPSSTKCTVQPLTLTDARLHELNSHLMLFYTGIKRTASDIASSYVDGMDERAPLLRQMGEYVEQSSAILGSQQDLTAFGELLHQAWLAKRSLSDKVSNPQVDALYDSARSAGAIGGKLLGAGGGRVWSMGWLVERQFFTIFHSTLSKLGNSVVS